MKKILIVYHSLGGNTKHAAEMVAEGCREAGAETILKPGFEAGPDDLLACDGLAVGTPDYFSYMAGGVKDFFDRAYYPTQGKVVGKPYVAFVTHGGGGKAVASVERVCASFKFRKAAEPLLVRGKAGGGDIRRLADLGGKLVEAVP